MEFFFKRMVTFLNRFSKKQPALSPVRPSESATSYQRSFKRFPIEFEVLVTAVDGDVPFVSERSELHDVSGGGAMFISRHPEKYFLGQLLKLDIFLAGTRDVRACVKTEASVVRIHDIEENESAQSGAKTGIAVKFHQPFEFERQDPSFFPGNQI
jgi:hypothetical protein